MYFLGILESRKERYQVSIRTPSILAESNLGNKGMHGWCLVFSAFRYNLGSQGQGQNPENTVGVVDRGQRELTGNPLIPPAQAPQFPPPGFIDNPAVSILRGPQGELGPPQGPVPADGPNSLIPPPGPFPGGLPKDFNQQGSPPFPGNYYPQPGSYYPRQGPPIGNSGPQGPAPGDVFVPGGFNAQAAGGIPGTYDPLDPSEYGTQFFNRALQTRLKYHFYHCQVARVLSAHSAHDLCLQTAI